MRVVATSDTHGRRLEIPECDLLLIGGDVSPTAMRHGESPIGESHDVAKQRYFCREHFFPWLETLPAEHIVWIAGNHDFFTEDPSFSGVLKEQPENVAWLCDSTVEVEGLTIYGSPWVPNLVNWAWYADTEHFRRLGAAMPDCDVALLHGPPWGYLDFVAGAGHVGAPFIEEALQRARPELVVCGHIHEGYGKATPGGLEIYNVSHVDEFYDKTRPPLVIDL